MLKTIDRIFGWLLIIGSLGHTAGTIMWTQPMSQIFIWSLGSSLAAALLGTLNLVRAARPNDQTIAVITTVGTACWALLAFAFGKSIGNLLDPRPLIHMITALVLVAMGVLTILRSTQPAQALSAGSPAR
jgi:putative Ca2+/H+ antiporter (TMEM165/GDT1 family)